MTGPSRRLSVQVDGVALAPEEAVAMWERFSAHMEEHKGDLAGFAAKEGFASAQPSFDASGAVLLLSRTAPQQSYANAKGLGAPTPKAARGSGGRAKRRPKR
ncbi:MAG: hypothetical protein KC657_00320 [Myxococcales bacterium]|nr:hypothetical protein [Myxococcales bacterium]